MACPNTADRAYKPTTDGRWIHVACALWHTGQCSLRNQMTARPGFAVHCSTRMCNFVRRPAVCRSRHTDAGDRVFWSKEEVWMIECDWLLVVAMDLLLLTFNRLFFSRGSKQGVKSAIDPKRFKLQCVFCKDTSARRGACIQCTYGRCAVSYHPTCAHRAGVKFELRSGGDGDDVYFHSFCHQHIAKRHTVESNNSRKRGGGSGGNKVAFALTHIDVSAISCTFHSPHTHTHTQTIFLRE